jgi:hypothetical protein
MASVTEWLGKLFGSNAQQQNVTLVVQGETQGEKDYSNPIKTDRTLARQLYHNTNKYYTLAAHLVKPIINNNANFIGMPTLFDNKKVISVIDDVKIDYRKVHKSMDIEGDIFVWPQWDDEDQVIKLVHIPIDVVNQIFIDPITKKILGYKLVETVNYDTPTEANQTITITYIITKDIMIMTIEGSKSEIKKMRNPFGILPIVHFSNDRDIGDLYGHSDIESIEPQLKFYHELTYEAGAAQSRDGHPKLKVTTAKPAQWVDNNFGSGTYANITAGKGSISMADRDLFINGLDDDVAYLYLNKTTGDFNSISETAFTNIVEGSETPEINFGANIGTSLASVKEYRPVWIKKIEAKQQERTQPWLDVYDIIIMIYNFVNLKNLKADITMQWPKPNFASVKEQSEIVEAFAKAFEKMGKYVTNEEIYNTLVELDVFEMAETFIKHQEVKDSEIKKQETKENNSRKQEANNEGADSGSEAEPDDTEE